MFHADSGVAIKAKVAPPRLGGVRVGVFSTRWSHSQKNCRYCLIMFRSPHRPANIGLTLAKVEHVKGYTIAMSGVGYPVTVKALNL